MDTSFDLVALLKQRRRSPAKTHKIKPAQFVSVAGGVQKRLETNVKYRKSSRLSVFDRIRNISKYESPCRSTLTEVQQKAEHRKQQLDKWKQEKEKKKKEVAAQKKKPFVAAVAHRGTFGPPPPPKPVPSTSGRVTRSQALKQRNDKAKQTQSFAPKNATFKPPQFPQFETSQMPTLAPISRKKLNKSIITFNPVPSKPAPKAASTRGMRSKAAPVKPTAETKVTRQQNDKAKPQPKTVVSKLPPLKHHMFQSSSSSDIEQPVKRSFQNKTSKYQSSSNIERKHIKKIQSDTTSVSQSSFNSDSDQSLSKNTYNLYQSSSSSDQDVSKLQDTASMSQESSSEKEMEEATHTPQNKVPKSESSSEEKLRSPKSVELTPEQIIEEAKNSPFITCSRGKANARKEMKKKLDEGLLDEDNSHMESVTHFRRQLDSEISRITSVCEVWDKIFAQTVLPEPVQELVLAAVGQARLLVSQKMQQFAALVEACAARARGAALVTPADLHGFWDMLFMQVENVDMRFKKLEELRARDWAEEPPAPAARAPPRPAAARPAAASRARPTAGPSRLRDMIAAARKAKKEQGSQSSGQSVSEKSEPSPPESKTFEAGFFSISSPVKKQNPSAPATPANRSNSLLKTVLSSEAIKASASKNSASFAMLRASVMGKNVDIEGISPLVETPKHTPLNLYATPARSILKQANPVSARKSEAKLKTVLFHDDDEPSSPLSFASCAAPGGEGPAGVAGAAGAAGAAAEPAGRGHDKENLPARTRRSRLSRQDAEERSPVMTRSRRRSAHAPLAPAGGNTPPRDQHLKDGDTPRRSSRRRKSAAVV